MEEPLFTVTEKELDQLSECNITTDREDVMINMLRALDIAESKRRRANRLWWNGIYDKYNIEQESNLVVDMISGNIYKGDPLEGEDGSLENIDKTKAKFSRRKNNRRKTD